MRAVNLIPAEHRGGASVGIGRSEGAAYAVLVLVAGIALLAFLYGHADKQISDRRSQAATLTVQAQRAQAEASQLAPYTNFVAMREQRVKAVEDLVDSRFDWAHVFHEFGRVLPTSVSITSLTGAISGASGGSSAPAASAPASSSPTPASSTAAGPSAAGGSGASAASPVTSATPPGSVPVFNLTGCATSQPAVAQMLTRLRLIDGVANVTLQNSTKPAGGSAAGGAGNCAGGVPSFAAVVTFDPLPVAGLAHATKATVASTSAGGSR